MKGLHIWIWVSELLYQGAVCMNQGGIWNLVRCVILHEPS
jgi:hypothetical protein